MKLREHQQKEMIQMRETMQLQLAEIAHKLALFQERKVLLEQQLIILEQRKAMMEQELTSINRTLETHA